MSPTNVYDDNKRAESYARLQFPGTYYLAFRDLPAIIARHVTGHAALDFGCGAGRSTRFLKSLGFETVGVDIASHMLTLARQTDPGDYRLVDESGPGLLHPARFDLILSAFAFDNIPGADRRCQLLSGLRRLPQPQGHIVILGSTPEIYWHEWASFSTAAFPENRTAQSGETVRIVMTDVADQRPVVDWIWFHQDYLQLFEAAGLRLVAEYRPLGLPQEPYAWQAETTIAPWVVYVLASQ